MAFVTTQTAVIQVAGTTPPTLKVYGTYTNSAGGTGGILSAGYTNASGTLTAVADASIGGRTILQCYINTKTADATTVAQVQAYNTTRDRDEVTITTVADGTGTYVLECVDSGA